MTPVLRRIMVARRARCLARRRSPRHRDGLGVSTHPAGGGNGACAKRIRRAAQACLARSGSSQDPRKRSRTGGCSTGHGSPRDQESWPETRNPDALDAAFRDRLEVRYPNQPAHENYGIALAFRPPRFPWRIVCEARYCRRGASTLSRSTRFIVVSGPEVRALDFSSWDCSARGRANSGVVSWALVLASCIQSQGNTLKAILGGFPGGAVSLGFVKPLLSLPATLFGYAPIWPFESSRFRVLSSYMPRQLAILCQYWINIKHFGG